MAANTASYKILPQGKRLVFRKLSLADAPTLQQLWVQCSEFHRLSAGGDPSPQAGEQLLRKCPPKYNPEEKVVFGLFLGEQLVGTIDLLPDYPPGTWYLGLLMLAPPWRGQGLGREAMIVLEDWLRGKASRLRLAVLEKNPAGRRFWESQGFVWVKRRDDFPVCGELVTVHVLEKQLNNE